MAPATPSICRPGTRQPDLARRRTVAGPSAAYRRTRAARRHSHRRRLAGQDRGPPGLAPATGRAAVSGDAAGARWVRLFAVCRRLLPVPPVPHRQRRHRACAGPRTELAGQRSGPSHQHLFSRLRCRPAPWACCSTATGRAGWRPCCSRRRCRHHGLRPGPGAGRPGCRARPHRPGRFQPA